MNELIMVTDWGALLDGETSSKIVEFEKKLKEIKDAEDELKKSIIKEMESKGIIKIETDEMTITYIAPSDRENFDTKRFKFDHAEMYDEYVKMSPVKASVRIKLKEDK